MAFGRSAEDKAETKAAKERAEAAARMEREQQRFLATPVGRARRAFERGDLVFQYAHSVMSQEAIIIAMVGGRTHAKSADPSVILNAVCAEGWDIVNGSFVFIEQGQESRDKFLSSGQNVAVKGQTMGYYLFRRCPANRRNASEAELLDAVAAGLDGRAPVD